MKTIFTPQVEMCDTIDTAVLHKHENNELSQQHLEQYSHLFAKSCFKVLDVLMSGDFLTTDNCKEKAGTRSLPRRIKDLRDNYGVRISELMDGLCKEWFMTESDIAYNMELIIQKTKKVA